ncbi:50S ribosomal protein L10 [Candidatus Uhrbacteria bacterium RIFCSPHIGHO2_02_FULL_47_44]|uniref:Large ribosomal subunit protein uL10 n=1 Tax=Candidatus Uhrbacteria bacterium RIFCSPLOWO2_02_FULL_48_18 TaxID=1802408 RepID=A0A1F7V8Y4_9BACT|nr:MAG: 50S ribosomal protein L10 [Candidatus Uhrbacteria bacterium RIFCSPHIGHO2_01_FULL_47_10]OGL69832.1 MAG: 50S ribosomal protein L10 [Candidatus Uhrbacteria bacterium RIFCSPHIGHO2_02_FULL_47_44]OGL77452.1 MAG: 50S ribosomal protein L10 [Candidatus Uhrbacteria bacterium RIFCSPHIGHO2_12_FULL_47_12]OGL81813.1 MAG: 50S ribosomal protein L10 [Candidatus Uhrbacteria bacterium RIFCSPLOWO2_01_FULL_47_17]OGL86976.1 MAG: 50S ribosomal protein L10 [Candidatus Uhrbacteria bacterium RIFCSPLOWO2_02_FULL_
MPKTRKQKAEIKDELADKFGRMKSVVFTSVSGFTMKDADALRTKGKAEGVDFLVTKKTLLVRALEDKGITLSKDLVSGSLLTAISYTDEVAPAKIIADFSKGREGFKMVGGILEGSFVDSQAVIMLSTLPSKQELLAKLVGTLNAPVSGFVNTLAANVRGLVVTLNAISEKKA